MKARNVILSILILIFTFFLFSCSTEPEQTLQKYIPDDSYFVLSVNLKSFDEKLDFKEIKKLSIYKDFEREFKRNSPEVIHSILDDFSNSGIDIEQNFNFFMLSNKSNEYVCFTFGIKEAEDFEKIISELVKEQKYSELNGFKTLIIENSIMGWDENSCVVAGSEDYLGEKELEDIFNYLTSLKDENKLNGIENFNLFSQQKFDIGIWANGNKLNEMFISKFNDYEGYGDYSEIEELISLFQSIDYYEFMHGFVNFNDGEIVGNAKIFYKEGQDEMKNFYNKKIDQQILKNICFEEIMLAIGFSINMESLSNLEIVKEALKDAKDLPVTQEELFKIFSGDFIGIMSNFDFYSMKPEFVIGMKIGEEEVFDKFIVALGAAGLVKTKEIYSIPEAEVYMTVKDKVLYISMNKEMVDKIAKDEISSSNAKKQIEEYCNNSSVFFLLDFTKIINILNSEYGEDLPWISMITSIFDQFDKIIVTGDSESSEGKLVFKNSNENSIMTLLKMAERSN